MTSSVTSWHHRKKYTGRVEICSVIYKRHAPRISCPAFIFKCELLVLLITNHLHTYVWWWSFSLWVIRWSIYITNESMYLRCKCKIKNTAQTIDGDTIFLRGNSNREKRRGGEGEKFTITRRFTELHVCICIFSVRIGWKTQKSHLSRWRRRSIYSELFLLRRMRLWPDNKQHMHTFTKVMFE